MTRGDCGRCQAIFRKRDTREAFMIGALMTPYESGVFITAGIYALVTVGLYITMASGQFSVAHAALAGVGGYTAGVLTVQFGWPFWPSLGAGAVAGGLCGCLMAIVIRKMTGMLTAVATLALGQALSLLATNIHYVGGALGYSGAPLKTDLTSVYGVLAAVLFVLMVIRRTRFGLALVATGKDETVARALGISTFRMRIWAFTAGGAVAGLAGALLIQYTSVIQPSDLSFTAEVQYFMFLVVGGINTPWGAVVGAIGVTWLLELLRFSIQDRFWILGLALVVVVLVRPQGILDRRNLTLRPMRLFKMRDVQKNLPLSSHIERRTDTS